MMRRVLLDANILIGAFDPEPGNANHAAAKAKLEALLTDPQVKVALTPLIRYEVLRGARGVTIAALDGVLNGFHEFEVRGSDARRAAEIFQSARANGVPLNKRQFDVFHYVCAESNFLEFLSDDGDIKHIKGLVGQIAKNAKA